MSNQEQRPWRATAKAVEGDTLCPNPIASGPAYEGPIEAPSRPPEAVELPEALAALMAILPRLAAALDRQVSRLRIEPMALRIEEVADSRGLSRRAVERERAAGRFPRPDVTVGKMPLWRPETVRGWLDKGGGRP